MSECTRGSDRRDAHTKLHASLSVINRQTARLKSAGRRGSCIVEAITCAHFSAAKKVAMRRLHTSNAFLNGAHTMHPNTSHAPEATSVCTSEIQLLTGPPHAPLHSSVSQPLDAHSQLQS
jgi:hypothetical protein